MMNLGRHRRAAALGSLLAMIWPGALAAQDTNTTVGNPQLRNFQLPGERTTPPVQAQPATPAPTTPAARPPAAATTPPPASPTTTAATRQAPARTTAPAAAPTARISTRPTAEAPARTRPPAAPESAAPAAPRTQPTPAAPATTAPAPQTAVPAPQTAPVAAPAPAAPPPQESPASAPFNLLWLLLALPVLLGIGAVFLFRRRTLAARQEAERDSLAGALVPGERPAPAPAAPELLLAEVAPPAAEPVSEPAPAEAPRPWLELDIEPDRAAATQAEASLHYDLVVTNVGGEAARNIRIDTRMFNAADEQQIAAFLGGPIHRHSGSPYVTLPPGESLRLAAAIAMKAEEVRAIELQGRSIFVPTVAINVAYNWGEDGEGRTSKSWLVGRKAENPNARMGAFRLDLGPRIYRSVGRKDTKRVMV
jgi:hypothetical protein